MGIRDLFRKRQEPAVAETAKPPCPHTALVPRWDDASSIGKEELASGWSCSSCGALFTPDEYRSLRESEAARIKGALQD